MRSWAGVAIAAGVLVAALLASFAFGAKTVPSNDLWAYLTGAGGTSEAILNARLHRTVVATVVGAAMALSGTVLQGVTRNPLADPGLLGINAGAALAVVLGITSGLAARQSVIVFLALVGALMAAGFVAFLTRRAGGSPITMLLLGAAVTAGASSISSAVTILNQGALDVLRFWQVGSVAGRDLSLLWPSVPLLALGLALTLWAGSTLNTFAVGDDLASALGTPVGQMRALLSLGAVCLAAGAVAIAGPLAFVGLVVPHTARLLLGPDNRKLLPAALVLGPTLVLLADTVGRVISPPSEIPAGLVVMILGAPVLVLLVRRSVRS